MTTEPHAERPGQSPALQKTEDWRDDLRVVRENSTNSAPVFQLGSLTLRAPVMLAPMAGYTDAAMRRICHQFGAALCYTEMTNAISLLRNADKTWHLLETLPGEGPLVAHLYGTDPAIFGEAAACVAATGRFVAIDVNVGCPARKITSNGAGAALMEKHAEVGRIVAAMHAATTLPITVKTRIGPRAGCITVFDILREVEQNGGAALAVHGRFATQGHSGDVHLDVLAEVKRVARIPIFGNGGIHDKTGAEKMFRETGVDGILIAQGAIGNPWIFKEICDVSDAAPARRDLDELRAALDMHISDEIALQNQIAAHFHLPSRALPPEAATVATFRCHLFRYLRGCRGANHVRRDLNTMRTLDAVRAAIAGCLEQEALFRVSPPRSRFGKFPDSPLA